MKESSTLASPSIRSSIPLTERQSRINRQFISTAKTHSSILSSPDAQLSLVVQKFKVFG